MHMYTCCSDVHMATVNLTSVQVEICRGWFGWVLVLEGGVCGHGYHCDGRGQSEHLF